MTPSLQNAAGPFSVHGEQMQRGIAKHAFHQIHSAHGKTAEPRCFSSCCVCARGRWQEDLRSLKLFVTGIKQDAADDFPAEADVEDVAGDAEAVEEAEDDPEVLSVDAVSVGRLHSHIFDVNRYARLWPLIPMEELVASSVEHPSGKDKDGKPWRWLLNTKMLPSRLSPETVVSVCDPCAKSLCRKVPVMPKYALANSLWIGREPTVFRHGGKKLSPMTFLLLSLGRAVVQKIIAEKDKPGRKEEKQKGMRSNTVAFPQAKIRELVTTQLPAASDETHRFLSDTISIALVGCDPEERTDQFDVGLLFFRYVSSDVLESEHVGICSFDKQLICRNCTFAV